jgi:transposase
MTTTARQMELSLALSSSPDTVAINGRCVLRRQGVLRVVSVAGIPVHHWAHGDRIGEAHAMVNLLQCGHAEQAEVTRAFGCSTRTVRRLQRRYELAGVSGLGKASGRPKGTAGAPGVWVRTAQLLHGQGASVRTIAATLQVSVGAISKWLRRVGQPAATAGQSAQSAETMRWAPKQATTAHGQCGRCRDIDPTNRQIDRLLARLGKLEDAVPLFVSGKDIPRAGVLLAIPALVQTGIFAVAEEVYGSIGPAFYGLRSTMLALVLMALLRIRRPEGLKEHRPWEMGRLLGLDRAPEVKTLRRKLAQLARKGKAEEFGRRLARRRVEQRGAMMGFLYVDGHVRVYHGRRRISSAFVARMRLALPATTDYWVNDRSGDPLFVVTAEVNAGMVAMLPLILREIREWVGKRRVTVVFDRGGWSPKLFAEMIDSGFDLLTYRKGKWPRIARDRFATQSQRIEGRKISYELNDKPIRLLGGRLRLRQVTRLREEEHQTAVVTSRWDLSCVEVAYRMFERWRQENFFKYQREEYAIDALVDYAAEAEDPTRLVPNPVRRKVQKQLATARMELRKLEAMRGKLTQRRHHADRLSGRRVKMTNVELNRHLRQAQRRVKNLLARRKRLPKQTAVQALEGDPLMRLSRERKHLTNCIKMVAYQAESDLLALVRPHYARADQEGRTLIVSALQNAADVEVNEPKKELRIMLLPLSSAHRTEAIAAMCRKLNSMKVRFPGSHLRMHFSLASSGPET